MNELHPLTRARAYVQDLINGRKGYWWGYYASANYSQDPLGIQECVEELYQMRLDEAKRRK